jgi:hypothetical protein
MNEPTVGRQVLAYYGPTGKHRSATLSTVLGFRMDWNEWTDAGESLLNHAARHRSAIVNQFVYRMFSPAITCMSLASSCGQEISLLNIRAAEPVETFY